MKTAAAEPAEIATRLSQVSYEIGALENAGPALAERLAAAEAELLRAREHFERIGFTTVGVVPAERLRNFQKATVGALMVINSNALLVAERARIEREHQARGGFAFSAEERAERLAELRGELKRLEAARELGWREREEHGEAVDRNQFSPEMFLISDSDLAALAAGKEPAGNLA